MPIVDFEHEQVHGRHVESSTCVAPAVAGWVVGAPASDELALLHLIRFKTRAEASIPVLPVLALHLEHDLRGVVHVVDVVGRARFTGEVIAEVVCSGDHFGMGSIAAQVEPHEHALGSHGEAGDPPLSLRVCVEGVRVVAVAGSVLALRDVEPTRDSGKRFGGNFNAGHLGALDRHQVPAGDGSVGTPAATDSASHHVGDVALGA